MVFTELILLVLVLGGKTVTRDNGQNQDHPIHQTTSEPHEMKLRMGQRTSILWSLRQGKVVVVLQRETIATKSSVSKKESETKIA